MNTKRYADYLRKRLQEISPTRRWGRVKTFSDLLVEGPCYHWLRFSTFEPNPITGAFSGEIRTGYFLKKGQKIPIKGGSVSGTMQEAFKKAFFSR